MLILCQLVLLTLPTLAALRSHAEGFWGCLLIQFIVLVLSWLAGAMLLANPG